MRRAILKIWLAEVLFRSRTMGHPPIETYLPIMQVRMERSYCIGIWLPISVAWLAELGKIKQTTLRATRILPKWRLRTFVHGEAD